LANLTYFAQSINDRGDEYFEEFTQRHNELLTDQVKGKVACYVLVDDDETVVGRFNLYEVANGTADVGYRVAQRVAGQGIATSALLNLCTIAREELGLSTLKAATSHANIASQRVLEKVGFVAVGPTEVAGRPGVSYELALSKF
jgi:ribosomal-protein-alanine N-acetyltransferase